MTAARWRIAGIAIAVAVLILSWFVLINPTRGEAAALQEETASQQAASQQLRSRISLLKKQSEEMPAQEAKLAAIQQRMPATAALPTLIRNLTVVASDAHVIVASVTPGRPVDLAQPVAAAPAAADSQDPSTDEAGDSADSSDSSDSSSSAAASGPTGPVAQTMTLDITACGTFAELRSYLRELESMSRLTLVSGVSFSRGACAEGAAETDLTASINAYVFTLPNATASLTGTVATTTEGSSNE